MFTAIPKPGIVTRVVAGNTGIYRNDTSTQNTNLIEGTIISTPTWSRYYEIGVFITDKQEWQIPNTDVVIIVFTGIPPVNMPQISKEKFLITHFNNGTHTVMCRKGINLPKTIANLEGIEFNTIYSGIHDNSVYIETNDELIELNIYCANQPFHQVDYMNTRMKIYIKSLSKSNQVYMNELLQELLSSDVVSLKHNANLEEIWSKRFVLHDANGDVFKTVCTVCFDEVPFLLWHNKLNEDLLTQPFLVNYPLGVPKCVMKELLNGCFVKNDVCEKCAKEYCKQRVRDGKIISIYNVPIDAYVSLNNITDMIKDNKRHYIRYLFYQYISYTDLEMRDDICNHLLKSVFNFSDSRFNTADVKKKIVNSIKKCMMPNMFTLSLIVYRIKVAHYGCEDLSLDIAKELQRSVFGGGGGLTTSSNMDEIREFIGRYNQESVEKIILEYWNKLDCWGKLI
jgi:hypothetical protein